MVDLMKGHNLELPFEADVVVAVRCGIVLIKKKNTEEQTYKKTLKKPTGKYD